MSEKIKLISSKFSPYCFRVEMTLLEKEIAYEKEYINLAQRPDWFVKDAPLGKVPLLYVGDKILFESLAICEYLDDAYKQNPLFPQDPFLRAWHRSWIEFSNSLLTTIFSIIFAQNQDELSSKLLELDTKLVSLEKHLKFKPYFDGDKYSLIDICMASAFKPLFYLNERFVLEIFERHKNVAAYGEAVIKRGSMKKAVNQEEYEELFQNFLVRRHSFLLETVL